MQIWLLQKKIWKNEIQDKFYPRQFFLVVKIFENNI